MISLRINRSGQVWTADISYIPMQRGFFYLVAVMDWASRKVLSWRLSNTLEAFHPRERRLDHRGPTAHEWSKENAAMNPLNNLPDSRNTVVQRNSSGLIAFKWSKRAGRVTTCETPSHHAGRAVGAERERGGGASIGTSRFSGRPWGSRPAMDSAPESRSASPRPAGARSQRLSHHRGRGS